MAIRPWVVSVTLSEILEITALVERLKMVATTASEKWLTTLSGSTEPRRHVGENPHELCPLTICGGAESRRTPERIASNCGAI